MVNVATVDYLARKNAINFYVSAGAGILNYLPKAYNTVDQTGAVVRTSSDGNGLVQLAIPVGAGVKFRLSDRVALNFGYTATLLMVIMLTLLKQPVYIKTNILTDTVALNSL